MKIIQIAPCFVDLNSESGGVANIVRQICLHLADKKVHTILICTTTELGKSVSEAKFIQHSEYLTVHIVKQYPNPLLGPTKKILKILQSIDDISLVHIHTCFSSITEYSMKFLNQRNIPFLFTPHGKLSPNMFGNKKIFKQIYLNVLLKKRVNNAKLIITSSSNEIQYAKNLGLNNNFDYIFNGYPTVRNQEKDSESTNIGFKKPYLLFLGYLDPRKQPDLLIQAFRYSKAFESHSLVLAGPDSYGFKKELELQIKELNLEIGVHVFFTGRITGMPKWNLLKNAKALFLPSKGEGWPVVIAEAIGAELPVVISQECNFSEINEFKTGIEVRTHKIEDWANSINEICFNESLYEEMKKNLALQKNQFSWETITLKWFNSYTKIINETKLGQN